MPVVVEEWDAAHPRWAELQQAIAAQGQANWAAFTAEWQRSSHLLVALQDDAVVGFLRFVIQEIGPDMDCPPVTLHEEALTEAKVLAFGVDSAHRGQGIGRALQEVCIGQAQRHGCYQVRSYSGADHPANHRLKLALGFGVHPVVRADGSRGAYFVLPLLRDRAG